jgi:hypothetical protein
MKEKFKKLYRAAKRIVPILTVVMLLGQSPVVYSDLLQEFVIVVAE